MVIVSHRLSSLVGCHRIMVMEEGRLADIAPHGTLLERCPTYRRMWVQQNRHLVDEHDQHPVLQTVNPVREA